MSLSVLAAAALAAHFVSPLVKIRPGEPPPPPRAGKVSLARNECEGLQVYLQREGREAEVRLQVPPLEPEGRLKADALPIAPYQVQWIPVKTPSNAQGRPGLWPDPLLPLERTATLNATKQTPAVAYLEICAPEQQPPGRYASTLTIGTGEARRTLRLEVTVEPFTLPATSSLPNTFGISRYSIAQGHGIDPESELAHTLLAEYVRELLRHRVSAHGMGMTPPVVRFEKGAPRIDFSAWDREVDPFLSGKALDSGARFTTLQLIDDLKLDERQRSLYLSAVREHVKSKGFEGEVFFYAKDEPRPEDHPLVRAQSRAVRGAKGVRLLLTSPFDPRIDATADILAPPLNCFFPRKGPDTCPQVVPAEKARERLAGRAKLFWYQSCLVHGCNGGPIDDPKVERAYSGWASYMLDHPATSNRAMGPLAFLTGVDGELYFNTVAAYGGDPWKDTFAFGGNGEGTFFYPGTPARLGSGRHAPIGSLRLKHVRDGLEDYEYLRLLTKRGKGGLARRLVKQLTPNGYTINPDPKEWERIREAMARGLRGP